MKNQNELEQEITLNQQEQEAIQYAKYLIEQKQKSALSMLKDCPQNVYIDEWKKEEKKQGERVTILERLSNKKAKECDQLFEQLKEVEEEPNKAKYYDTFYSHKVSDYALKYGRLDYRTMAQCFDCVLCNNIVEVDPYIFDNIESGELYEYYDEEWNEIAREQYEELNEQGKETHEQVKDIYQWFLVDGRCALDLLREAGELVLYSEALDCYIWGVDHWGTSWDYVLTSIKLREKEGE